VILGDAVRYFRGGLEFVVRTISTFTDPLHKVLHMWKSSIFLLISLSSFIVTTSLPLCFPQMFSQ
jgi:hypothetical protein